VHFTRSLPRRFLCAALLLTAIPISTRAIEETGPSIAAQAAGRPYLRELESAASALAGGDFSKALEDLDLADQIQPEVPDTWNMRGAIYAQQHEYERAQSAFEKAERLNPSDFWAPYNIAELLLVQKKYDEAAPAFQKLALYRGHEELVEFKIVFADLMRGKPADAKPVLDAMKFPSDTAAYYFAQAAWSFAQKDQKEGQYWCKTGLKVFGLPRCVSFYDALAGAGWVPMRSADGSVPADSDITAMPMATPVPVFKP
jgi:tetratricopeptide (TPR) repeat protein